jgi:drug/metabolite transporter (DMT)-like permease
MTPPAGPLLGGAAALVGAIAYGINIPAARMAGQAGVSGASQAMIRGLLFIGILALLLLALKRSFRITDGESGRIALMGLCAGATGACYLSAVTFVPVAIGVTIFYTFPLLLILATPFTGGGRITPSRILAFGISFAGIITCVGPGFGALDWRGVALAFAASMSCAVLFQITATVKQDQMRLLFWIQVFAQCFIIPAALLSGLPTASVLGAAALPVLVSGLGFYIGFAGQLFAGRALRPATVGLLFLLEPVIAILTAQVLLSESLTHVQYLGIALVISGLALDVWTQSRAAPASAA